MQYLNLTTRGSCQLHHSLANRRMPNAKAVLPPIISRAPVMSDTTFVGTLNTEQRVFVKSVNMRINEYLAFLLSKYPFLGIAVFLYCKDKGGDADGSAQVSLTFFKTEEENRRLKLEYPNARITATLLRSSYPLIREVAFGIVEKAIRIQLATEPDAPTFSICCSILFEMPDGSGASVWMDGEAGDSDKRDGPAFVYYVQHLTPRMPAIILSPSEAVGYVPRYLTAHRPYRQIGRAIRRSSPYSAESDLYEDSDEDIEIPNLSDRLNVSFESDV